MRLQRRHASPRSAPWGPLDQAFLRAVAYLQSSLLLTPLWLLLVLGGVAPLPQRATTHCMLSMREWAAGEVGRRANSWLTASPPPSAHTCRCARGLSKLCGLLTRPQQVQGLQVNGVYLPTCTRGRQTHNGVLIR